MIRWILDGSMLISGILLHGTYGVVTIINLLVLGKLITAALALLRRQSGICSSVKIEEEISL